MSNCQNSCCNPFIGYADPCKIEFLISMNDGFSNPNVFFGVAQDDKGNVIRADIGVNTYITFEGLNENALYSVSFRDEFGVIIPVCVDGALVDYVSFRTKPNLWVTTEPTILLTECPII